MTCEFEINDGAYLLGAITPAQRAEFERHLAGCPQCRESVAQLAVLPGLLSWLVKEDVPTDESRRKFIAGEIANLVAVGLRA